MSPHEHRRISEAAFSGAAMLLALAVLFMVVRAATADTLLFRRDAVPSFVVAAVACAVALLGWRHERLAARRQAADVDALRTELEEREANAKLSADQARERLRAEREQRLRIERLRRAESEWNRELRTQISQMYRTRGTLSDSTDIRALLLRIAVTLLEGEKGLLLSRKDADSDGDLDLAAAEGFDHDPERSGVAQHFAELVIARDRTVRVADIGEIAAERESSADAEIRDLVAIPIYIHDEFDGVVVVANGPDGFASFDDEVLLALGDHAGAILENASLHGALRGAYLSTVSMLADVIEASDPFLRGHSEEVASYVVRVAERLEIPSPAREALAFASLLHDVGKLGISERILLKPGLLTAEEFAVVKLHPRIGYRLVQQVPLLEPIAPAVLHHHERWDGGGYPAGLIGEEIPIEARIIFVADAFAAMTSGRPYRPRMSLDEACAELERAAGTQFDPAVVQEFVAEVRRTPLDLNAAPPPIMRDLKLQLERAPDEPLLGAGPLSLTDNLTLLYTHRYCHEQARWEAQRAVLQDRPFGVLFVEVSNIADVNALEGYQAGDALLQQAARAVQHAASRAGGTACRYGGRRLCLIAPAPTEATMERLSAEIAAEVGAVASLRCGSAIWQDGESGDETIARARLALLSAPLSQPDGS